MAAPSAGVGSGKGYSEVIQDPWSISGGPARKQNQEQVSTSDSQSLDAQGLTAEEVLRQKAFVPGDPAMNRGVDRLADQRHGRHVPAADEALRARHPRLQESGAVSKGSSERDVCSGIGCPPRLLRVAHLHAEVREGLAKARQPFGVVADGLVLRHADVLAAPFKIWNGVSRGSKRTRLVLMTNS